MTAKVPSNLIVVDVGNTRLKCGHVVPRCPPGCSPIAATLQLNSREINFCQLASFAPLTPAVWHIASVCSSAADRLVHWIQAQRGRDQVVRIRNSDFPIANRTRQPERVGQDRLAAAVAAKSLKGNGRAAIIVDAGTAITIDAVSQHDEFLGGVIFPGPAMATRALARDTEQLPMVHLDIHKTLPEIMGRSTDEAIAAGVYWGTTGAIRAIVERMRKTLDVPVDLFLTGGDIPLLATETDSAARWEPDLVVWGIAIAAGYTGQSY